eukprot:m.343515 g.343515  ORF g.343515 m.343515 type:complete len:507 (-) comp22945_c0_seq1:64-1584(-)
MRLGCNLRFHSLQRKLVHSQARQCSVRKQLVYPNPEMPGCDRVGFWTDIEGNWEYFARLVKQSQVLQWNNTNTELELKPKCGFVYGGDCFDKGKGDIRISNLFVQLKRKHPDKVVLLIGNRDVNKMRFLSELHHSDIECPAVEWKAPFYLQKYGVSLEEYLQIKSKVDSPLSRLQYILEKTMGSPDSLQFRRQELAELSITDVDEIDWDKVFESYSSGIGSNGFYRNYLQHSQLACVYGNTLFVHGGLTQTNLGFVPDMRTRYTRGGDSGFFVKESAEQVQNWVEQLENFTGEALNEWTDRPLWDSLRERRGGEALMAYGHTSAMRGKTAMVETFLLNGNLNRLSKPVVDYLHKSGIKRVVSGHKPFADSPGIIRHQEEHHMEVITADTSYSDTTASDNRGVAAFEVIITGGSQDNHSVIHGTFANGDEIEFSLPELKNDEICDRFTNVRSHLVGIELDDGWWVKAPKPHCDQNLLAVKGQGFDVRVKQIHFEEVMKHVKQKSGSF